MPVKKSVKTKKSPVKKSVKTKKSPVKKSVKTKKRMNFKNAPKSSRPTAKIREIQQTLRDKKTQLRTTRRTSPRSSSARGGRRTSPRSIKNQKLASLVNEATTKIKEFNSITIALQNGPKSSQEDVNKALRNETTNFLNYTEKIDDLSEQVGEPDVAIPFLLSAPDVERLRNTVVPANRQTFRFQ